MNDGIPLEDRQTYTVQEAAERTGLSAHTLRYYERAGLIATIDRAAGSGHRRYTERDITFIEFLKRLRATGMPVSEMQRYAALVRQGDDTREERREMLVEHGDRVRAQVAELQASLAVIDGKVENYRRLGVVCEPSEPPAHSLIEMGKDGIK